MKWQVKRGNELETLAVMEVKATLKHKKIVRKVHYSRVGLSFCKATHPWLKATPAEHQQLVVWECCCQGEVARCAIASAESKQASLMREGDPIKQCKYYIKQAAKLPCQNQLWCTNLNSQLAPFGWEPIKPATSLWDQLVGEVAKLEWHQVNTAAATTTYGDA